jgi:putative endonuclease (uncharacterized protein DUF1780)
MGPEEIIERFRRAREEQVRFFSNAAKPERERWIVHEFLKTLSISFSEDELYSPKESDDVDVVFRDANFQVKELPEPDCRRSSDVLEDLKRAETATHPTELFGPLVAKDLVFEDAYPFIQTYARHHRYPPSSRSKLHLLVYVTHPHAVLNRKNQPSDLSALGWRSISCLFGPHAYVLVAAEDAPPFLSDELLRQGD